jgi:hypothetical protein
VVFQSKIKPASDPGSAQHKGCRWEAGTCFLYDHAGLIMAKSQNALLTDLYQLNMMAAYLEHGITGTAVFELFVRKLPSRRGFLMTAGLEQALQFLESVSSHQKITMRSASVWDRFLTASLPISDRSALPETSTRCRKEQYFFRMSRSFK